MKLNWHRTTESPSWCSLKADDGRIIALEFWFYRAEPVKCSTCLHSIERHEVLPSQHCTSAACDCRQFIPGTNPRFPVRLTTEVRFRGLVIIENGGNARSVARAAWRGAKVKPGKTTSMVRLHAMPLGSLLAVAQAGLSLELKPRKKYAHGRAIIGARELTRLSVATDLALEAGEWNIDSETTSPGLPAAVAQLEAFR